MKKAIKYNTWEKFKDKAQKAIDWVHSKTNSLFGKVGISFGGVVAALILVCAAILAVFITLAIVSALIFFIIFYVLIIAILSIFGRLFSRS